MDEINKPKPTRATATHPTRHLFVERKLAKPVVSNTTNTTKISKTTKTPKTVKTANSPKPQPEIQHEIQQKIYHKPKRPKLIPQNSKHRINRIKRLLKVIRVFIKVPKTTRGRIIALSAAVVIAFSVVFPIFQVLLIHKIYALTPGEAAVLLPTNKTMADKLKLDNSKQAYLFNQDFQAANRSNHLTQGGSYIKAQIDQDPTKGLSVTDPMNNVDFKVKPLFKLGGGQQQENRVVFPAFNGGGHLVYTAGAIGVKQEVTLQKYIGDKLKYSYELELGDSYAAKLESNGSVGIYGSSLPLNGNVSTGNDKDAALLKKARQAAAKDKLLFGLPAPIIKETNRNLSKAKAHYVLKGNKLDVIVEHLKSASYPLSIDPTVTAASGSGLFSFDANIETNVYVDPTNNFFERSPLTGGNLLTWGNSTPGMTVQPKAAHFLGAAVVYGGTLYLIGGADNATTNITTGTNTHLIEQSKISTTGTLGDFSDGNYSGLPSGGLARFQALTYNGYIYLINGINGFTSTAAGGTFVNTNFVYYTRVTSESFGAFNNGAQLKNWSTTTNKPATQVYDYGATVYNGTIYMAGGLDTSNTAKTTVLSSTILPSGDLAAFAPASASLPAGRFGLDMQAYNGHIYVLGGNTGTVGAATLTSSTLYASVSAADGSVVDTSWKTGNGLVSSNGSAAQAMENFGTQFSMIYNGYLYVTGGCTAVNGSGACTAVAAYSQLAQLNADGSLGSFFPNDFQAGGTSSLPRTGTPTLGYNGNIYSIAGCSAMLSTAVSCSSTQLNTSYATVNTIVGDISDSRTPTSLPANLYGHATVVLNGYLYIIGGCLTDPCNTNRAANYITYYATVNNDGSLGTFNNNTVSTTTDSPLNWAGQVTPLLGSQDCAAGGADQCGLAGIAAVTYNGYIYVIAGNDGNVNTSNVYYMKPDATNGQQGLWTTVTNALPTAMTEAGTIEYNGAIYVVGGCTANAGNGIGCTAYQTAVYKSTIGAAGAPGAFATTNQLQLAANLGIGAFGISLYGGYIYLTGGAGNYTAAQGGSGSTGNNGQSDDVWRAKINSSGNIVNVSTGLSTGGWKLSTAHLTKARRRTNSQAINGYLYVVGGHNACDPIGTCPGTGTTYGDVQIAKIDLSTAGTGDILGDATSKFTASSTSTLTPRWNAAVAFGSGFMYVTGGCVTGSPPASCSSNSSGSADKINESFVVYNADNLGNNSWANPTHTYAADLSQANRLGMGSAVYNGYLYVAGGCSTFTVSSLSCTAVNNTSAYAQILADGTLGTWTAGPTFTTGTAFGQLVANNGYLYYMGGQTGSALSTAVATVYKSTIGASGVPGAFSTTSQTTLPTLAGRTQASAVAYAGFIFSAGGNTGSADTGAVYHSTINGSGDITAWTATTQAFTGIRRELSLVSAGAYLFVIGGFDGTNYLSDVQVGTPSTSTGDITTWSYNNEIPYKQAGMSAVGANGYIYTFGGRSGVASTSCTKSVSYASVNGNGTIGDWQQPFNVLTVARFGAAIGYSNGYFYLSGGDDCTNILTTNVVQQSGQLSEAIHATYTRYVDFGADATFRQLYVTGTNAAIGGVDIDRWKIIVKTSTTANGNTAWGQKSNFTLTNFGYSNPITFQALNASGVNQGASQFWDITFDIDQAQSFNFPDASTPPQITKYDFYFSPGPGKRLRDGKTFINETQSTLDAHP